MTPLVAEEVSHGLDICIGCEVHTPWEVGSIYLMHDMITIGFCEAENLWFQAPGW